MGSISTDSTVSPQADSNRSARGVLRFDCAGCGRLIGEDATHYLMPDRRIVCRLCLFDPDGTRRLHNVLHPECRDLSHDVWDHGHPIQGTRGAMAEWLRRSGSAA